MPEQYSLHKCCDGHELWEIVVTPSGKNLHELIDVVAELNRLSADVAKLRAEVLHLEQQHALAKCGFDASQNIVAELRCENERLREERRWIPVEERLPEAGVWVICYHATHRLWFQGMRDCGEWTDAEGVLVAPTHWQPLPAPPQEEE